MSAMSDYLENKLLDAILRNTTYAAPATIYLGLYTSAPTDTGSGIEVGGGAYDREGLASGFPAASGAGGSVSNSSAITFTTASGTNWGTVSHVMLLDENESDSFTNADVDTTNDDITLTGHTFDTGDQVSISREAGAGTFPSGITEGAIYYARDVDANTIQLHATAAGAAANTGKVDITAAGSGTFWIRNGNPLLHGALASSKTVNIGDTFQIDASNLTVTFA